jgi:TetR/AcrR family transcriptional regulator, regulator of cefoperazone and chloramphenicol sensitivity
VNIETASPASSPSTTTTRILASALQRFADDGVAATSLRSVADAAGVSVGLVQHHFGTKERLRQAVDEHVIGVVSAAIESEPLPEPPGNPLAELGHRVTGILRGAPAVLRYVGRALVEGDAVAFTVFDQFVELAAKQWDELGARGLLRDDIDRLWTPLHSVALILGTAMFQMPLSRHLPAPLTEDDQLRRWDSATEHLLRHGLFHPETSVMAEPRISPPATLEFVREHDRTTYRFKREPRWVNHHPSYKRTDADIWCRWLPNNGWCTCDDTGNANGWPLAQTRSDTAPPIGYWRSFKHGDSYLYRLQPPSSNAADS